MSETRGCSPLKKEVVWAKCCEMRFSGTFTSFEHPNASLFMLSLYTSFPIRHMLNNDLSRALRTMLSTYSFDKIAFWVCSSVSYTTIMFYSTHLTHQIEINTVIHQVIHPWLHTLRRTKVHPIFLTHIPDLFPCSRQAHKTWMKFCQIMLQNSRCVSGRITSDEEGQKRSFAGRWIDEGVGADAVLRGGGDEIDHVGHLVKLIRADVWTVGEAEVNLDKTNRSDKSSRRGR